MKVASIILGENSCCWPHIYSIWFGNFWCMLEIHNFQAAKGLNNLTVMDHCWLEGCGNSPCGFTELDEQMLWWLHVLFQTGISSALLISFAVPVTETFSKKMSWEGQEHGLAGSAFSWQVMAQSKTHALITSSNMSKQRSLGVAQKVAAGTGKVACSFPFWYPWARHQRHLQVVESQSSKGEWAIIFIQMFCLIWFSSCSCWRLSARKQSAVRGRFSRWNSGLI